MRTLPYKTNPFLWKLLFNIFFHFFLEILYMSNKTVWVFPRFHNYPCKAMHSFDAHWRRRKTTCHSHFAFKGLLQRICMIFFSCTHKLPFYFLFTTTRHRKECLYFFSLRGYLFKKHIMIVIHLARSFFFIDLSFWLWVWWYFCTPIAWDSLWQCGLHLKKKIPLPNQSLWICFKLWIDAFFQLTEIPPLS